MFPKDKVQGDIEILLDSEYGYVRAGYPKFMRLFGRDSLIVAWQMLNIKPDVCRSTLEILSKLQGKKFDSHTEEEPGRIIHETDLRLAHHPGNPEISFPYYGSIDSTALYVIMFGKYFKKTGDKEFVQNHAANIKNAVEWILRKIKEDSSGFVRYGMKKEKWQVLHQGWKDSYENHLAIDFSVAVVEVQGYVYLALTTAAGLLNDQSLFKEAQNLKERFNDLFWMPDLHYFALALDGKDRQRRAVTSNPGHLLFTGVLDKDRANYVVSRIIEPDMFTAYGIRTHSSKEPDFNYKSYHLGSIWPHDNWMIAEGCKEMGYNEVYKRIRQAILKAYEEFGYITEQYGVTPLGKLEDIPTACRPQAWASAAVLEFLTNKV